MLQRVVQLVDDALPSRLIAAGGVMGAFCASVPAVLPVSSSVTNSKRSSAISMCHTLDLWMVWLRRAGTAALIGPRSLALWVSKPFVVERRLLGVDAGWWDDFDDAVGAHAGFPVG